MGPRELFYADIFASRETGCRSQMGLPGIRDQHSGCVGAWLAARDLYDFLLLSLPDNDTLLPQERPARPADVDRGGRRPDHARRRGRGRPGARSSTPTR